jgi:hypothetical protein
MVTWHLPVSLPRSDEAGRTRITMIARLWWAVTIVGFTMLGSFDSAIRSPAASVVHVASFLALVSAVACVVLVREVTTAQSRRFAPVAEPVAAQA